MELGAVWAGQSSPPGLYHTQREEAGGFLWESQAHITNPKREAMLQEDDIDFLFDIFFVLGCVPFLFFSTLSLSSSLISLSVVEASALFAP